MTHELTHGTESSKYYPILKNLVEKTYGDNWQNALDEKAKEYEVVENYDAEKEVVARYVEKHLGDEKFIDDLIKYNYSLASKIWQDLKSLGANDETAQIRDAFKKAFADNYQQNIGQMSFTKEKDFDEYEYNLAKDIKNELSLEEIATIRNNLQLNNAKGLGVTYVPDKIVTVYAKGYNDFKVLDYNEIDDARTIGTISRQNEGAINTDTLANDGSFGDVGLTNSLYEDDKLVGGKQGTGLRFDGFSESSNTNQGGITRSNPLTDNQYNDMVKKYMEKNGKTRFSLDEQTQLHKDRAIEEYGITNNPMLAEYLMDDGKFLDFSERQN